MARPLKKRNRSDFVRFLARKQGIPQESVLDGTKVFFDGLKRFLVWNSRGCDLDLVIPTFGKFSVKRIRRRNVRNPMTGERMKAVPSYRVSLRLSSEFRKMLRGGFDK